MLDATWLIAIGHVAFLDTYIKSVKLGWAPQKTALLAYNMNNPPGWGGPLAQVFFPRTSRLFRQIPTSTTRSITCLRAAKPSPLANETIRDRRRAALSRPFWYGSDGSGRVRWYGPLGAEVEAAWKAGGRPALISLSDTERKTFRRMDTVRSTDCPKMPGLCFCMCGSLSGFHSGWHKFHAGTRNADIGSYQQVIDFVISQGGWVVRGGDPSMTPISPRERVIDYATSAHRSPEIDIYLCAECAYFVAEQISLKCYPRRSSGSVAPSPNWSPDWNTQLVS